MAGKRGGGKTLAPIQGQRSIAKFFSPKSKTASTSSTSPPTTATATATRKSIFPVGKSSKVLRKVQESSVAPPEDDDDATPLYQKPVFVSGYVKQFHPKETLASSSEDTWTVQWDTDATAATAGAGSTVVASPRSVTSSSSDTTINTTTTSSDCRHSQYTESQIRLFKEQFKWIGTNVCKLFPTGNGNDDNDDNDDDDIEEYFDGQVVDMDEVTGDDGRPDVLYTILYEDGDYETISQKEFMVLFNQTNANNKKKKMIKMKRLKRKQEKTKKTKATTSIGKKRPSPSSSSSSASAAAAATKSSSSSSSSARGSRTPDRSSKRAKVSYKEIDSDDDEVNEVMVRHDDDDKEVFRETNDANFDSDDSIDEDDFDNDDINNDNNKSPVKPLVPRKPSATTKASAAAKPKTNMKAKAKTTATNRDSDIWTEFNKMLEKDKKDFKPNNNPQKIKEGFVDFVDPVGVDPTDGIVERIMNDQVRKVGGLLMKVFSRKDPKSHKNKLSTTTSAVGRLSYPIKLSTACSGTDAPSIALSLIEECMNKMRPENHFSYDHLMSCEIEPFKQGYLGRNFPGALLFPDITRLSETDAEGRPKPIEDVYGRLHSIPSSCLFIAGTSCKDFSMLKTRDRKDIEDKGQSGQTFLAAVEYLDLYAPPFAIFENVDGAPWEKMQEYITGRVDLTNRNNDKDITTKNTKASKKNADKDLKFKVNDDGFYEVDAVPPQMGIRAGSIVDGVAKVKNPAKVRPIIADERIGTEINLGQLAKKHGIKLGQFSADKKKPADQGDILVFKKKVTYCTYLVKLDTKDYGLPQTRNRKYLFIWRSDDPNDDLGDYFNEIMDHLKTDLLYSMESFLLPPMHDRIRCFREALRSGPGLLVARDRAKELDFWDWELSRVKDLTKHKAVRENLGLPDRMRWLTQWGPRGEKKLAPGIFPELADCWNHRRLDMIDCFAGAAIRDAISRDPCSSSFVWDLSQNVSRAPFRSSTVGVSGCVTPGGELFMPHLGRTMMGYEKLLLQGIPFSRLVLGKETEVQLSDLAGNAMSVPVVGAAILAAICAPYLREQCQVAKERIPLSKFEIKVQHDFNKGVVIKERGDLYKAARNNESRGLEDVIRDLADNFATRAYHCSVLCTSESSGTCATDSTFLECKNCGWRVSHSAADRYQVDSHDLAEHLKFKENERPDPHLFERTLRNAAPSILRLSEGSESMLSNGTGLESYSFQLQQVNREAGKWVIVYGAWEDYGKGRQVAECRIDVGRLSALSDLGAAAFIKCFAPAIRENPIRGKLSDSARVICKAGQSAGLTWETPHKAVNCTLTIKEEDDSSEARVPSLRKLIGLNDSVATSLRNHNVTKQFVPPFAAWTRNPYKDYPTKWKLWPGVIVVSDDPSGAVNGRYKKMSCNHTVHLSSLWRRDDGKMNLFFRPNVVRTGLDVAVFSPSPSYKDEVDVCELHDWIPENVFDVRTQKTKAKLLAWTATKTLRLEIPKPIMNVEAEGRIQFEHEMMNHDPNKRMGPVLCRVTNIPQQVVSSLLEYTCTQTENVAEIDLFGKFGTRNAKRLSIVAGPTLLKFAANGDLPVQFGQFYLLPSDIPDLGRSETHCPIRPRPQWVKRSSCDFSRYYDPEESNNFWRKLLARPSAFNLVVDQGTSSLCVHMNPYVLAHRAASILGGEKTSEIKIEYSLNELSSMGEPIARPFQVPNSDSYMPTSVELLFPLYPRQAKALTRMMDIESGSVVFKEEERAEENLPGVGWCVIAKAFKESPLRGGVLGDAIGSGKTVITIGLICKKIEQARSSRNIKLGQSGATLIVVPPGLLAQWEDEFKKFTGKQLTLIVIDSVQTLKQTSVKALCTADVVICPAGIIEEGSAKNRPYTDNLKTKAKADPIPPAPSAVGLRECPTIEGSWVRNMSSGPEIYVGNKSSQQDRDMMAYYSYTYASAIEKLRSKKFGESEKGIPLEWFTWYRVVVDEAHEVLVTGKGFKKDDFKDTARRGAREFLGVAQTDPKKRPLRATVGVWGLTGTPLLETEARVTELANLMGGTYITGAAHHWRREERESGRDMFLSQTESVFSREYRCAVQAAAHRYVREACQRNRGETLSIKLNREQLCVNMCPDEAISFLKEIQKLDLDTYSVNVDHLDEKTDTILRISASSAARQKALVGAVASVLTQDPSTKIIVFATTAGYDSASAALNSSDFEFCKVCNTRDSVERQNEIISWFRHLDLNEGERRRPRILLLDFVQAAGHNLQAACHNVIFYDPVYSSSDAVADVSTEEQALGRVYRQGQTKDVTCTRIVVKGPDGQPCVDDWIIDRNLNEDFLNAATSNF